jgi:hypothetical protein
LTSIRWRPVSSQISCTSFSGAPDSSNCPPGSSEIEAYRAVRIATLQGDDVARLLDRGPAEPLQAGQHGEDAVRTVIGRAAQGRAVEAEFLVLGADAPFGLGLGPLRHGADQVFPGKRFGVGHADL